MKTVIKLILIYYLLQIFGSLVAAPCVMVYEFATTGTLDVTAASTEVIIPAMLLGFVFITIYLWKNGYLVDDGRIYAFTPYSQLGWGLLAGVSGICLTDALMSQLTFLPDLMKQTFDTLQSGWGGILCIALIGPVLEEFVFRRAVMKALLQKYSPAVSILISGLLFGVVHLNPAQIVSASLMGFLLAWIYWRTRSLIPCILIHVLNNSLSVYLSLNYPEVETTAELLGNSVLIGEAVLALALFLLSVKKLSVTKHTTNIEA